MNGEIIESEREHEHEYTFVHTPVGGYVSPKKWNTQKLKRKKKRPETVSKR